MPSEAIALRTRDGQQSAATAEVKRFTRAERSVRAGMAVLIGIVAGLAMIPIPLVHLVAPWGFPLVGIGMAVMMWRNPGKILSVSGTCPACSEPLQLGGNSLDNNEAVWERCSGCSVPIELVFTDPE